MQAANNLLLTTCCSRPPLTRARLTACSSVQVDELYNHRTRLVCSAAAPPDQLFAGADHSEPIIDLEALQVGTRAAHGLGLAYPRLGLVAHWTSRLWEGRPDTWPVVDLKAALVGALV